MKVLILVDDYEQLHQVINVEHNIGNLYYRDDGMPYTKDQFLLIADIEEMVDANNNIMGIIYDNVQLRKANVELEQSKKLLDAIAFTKEQMIKTWIFNREWYVEYYNESHKLIDWYESQQKEGN